MVQDVGNIELSALLETEPMSAAYHTGILASSIAHGGISCRKKQWSIENSLNIQWIFFQSLSMSSRKEDLMDTDMGECQETNNIIWLIN